MEVVRKPITLRVRLAFGAYPVGWIFTSPPLAGTLRQDWLSKGLLEVIDEEESPITTKTGHGAMIDAVREAIAPKRGRGRPPKVKA